MQILVSLLFLVPPAAHASRAASIVRMMCDRVLSQGARVSPASGPTAELSVIDDPRSWLVRSAVDPDSLRLKITRSDWEEIVGARPQPHSVMIFEFLSRQGELLGIMHFERHLGSWISHSECSESLRKKGFGTFMYAASGYVFLTHFRRGFTSMPRMSRERVRSEGATKLWLRLTRLGMGRIIADDEHGSYFHIASTAFEGETGLSRYIAPILGMEGDLSARVPAFLSGDLKTLIAGPNSN